MVRISVSNDADVVEAVRAARDSRRTLEIVGAGTKRGFGRPVDCDDTLDLSGLSGIVKYEPDELVITARAGTLVTEIDAALAEKNQRLGFEPADWGPLFGALSGAATIGGVLSANCDGSAAVRYGRCRDHLLGFRAVNGFGEAYKGGGKVVKNVTGFDLPKLFCGAMGTFGPLTEVTLRAFPKAERVQRFAVRSLEDGEGFDLLRRVASSPIEATGLAFRHRNHAQGDAAVRLEGSYAAVAEKTKMLRTLANCDLVEDDGGLFASTTSGRLPGRLTGRDVLDIWLVDLLASKAADFPSFGETWVSDWAGARRWLLATPSLSHAHMDHSLAGVQGRAKLIRASEATRRRVGPWAPESPPRAALTQRIKDAFDPLRLFNPGRMWEGV